MAQNYNPSLSPEDKKENLIKAKSHLMRLTLDCYKLLWVVLEEDLKRVYDNSLARIFCVNLPSYEIEGKYYEIKKLAQEARKVEAENIGTDPLISINSYKRVTKSSLDLLGKVDNGRLLLFNSVIRTISIKRSVIELFISFVAGLLSGIVITYPDEVCEFINSAIKIAMPS